ncbi:hypothetical protein F511_07381 [Dorcoceras hygrometricum]|uniref:SP-RING-type domain-containing protein n=1 Tax=Dorcoceras hygrometricum TaxID=472368 RepID=A0A2Z7BBA1_9LAMI|nr:hypothetical protein F511_07381 [Dorcoceras hygrometricum]
MNSRVPSWRCPHCNQHVCFTDIRIERKMVKILEAVGANDTEVIFASDGSWNVGTGNDDSTQKSMDNISINAQNEPPQSESVPLSKAPADVLDLTAIDDAICVISDDEIQDMALNPTYKCQTETPTVAVDSQKTSKNDGNQSNTCLDDDFWSGLVLPNFFEVSSQSNSPIDGVSATTSNKIVQTSVFTQPVGPKAPTQELESIYTDALLTASVPRTVTSLSTTLPFQQHQFGTSAITNEYGRFPSLPRNVTRTPTVVQALPVQASDSVPPKRPRTSVNTFTQNNLSAASQASPPAQMTPNSARMNPLHTSQWSSSPLHQYTGIQRNHSFSSIRSSQPSVPDQGRNSFSASNDRRSSTPPHLVGQRMPASAQSPVNFPRPQTTIGVSQDRNLSAGAVTSQQTGMPLTLHTSGQMARPVELSRTTPSYTIPNKMSSTRDQVKNPVITSSQGQTIGVIDSAEPNWRPAARMRGALSGQAYTDALNQFIIRPNQQAQVARPSLPANVPAHLQSLMADATAPRTPEPSHASGAPVTRSEV